MVDYLGEITQHMQGHIHTDFLLESDIPMFPIQIWNMYDRTLAQLPNEMK